MDASLLTQTIVSGAVVSALILVFLCRFGPRRARWPQIAAGVIFLDQVSKWLVAQLVRDGATHEYLAGMLRIGYHTNFLQGFGSTSPFLLCTTLVGAVGCVRLYQMLNEQRYAMSAATEAGLALILGGVAAIALERAWAGFVIDFLMFGSSGSYVFNFADLAALAGGVVLFARGVAVLPEAIDEELAAARSEKGAK